MRLPTTTSEYDSDSVGNEPRDWFRVLGIIGCSSDGTVNVPIVKSTGSSLLTAFGFGALTRFGTRAIAKAKSPIVVVKAVTVTPGQCGDTRFSATPIAAETEEPADIGTVTFTGAAYDNHQMGIQFSIGGEIGEAYYKLTDDGGFTWSTAKLLTADIVIVDKNITIEVSDEDGDFVEGNTFWSDTTGPETDSVGFVAAQAALNAYTRAHPAIVVSLQGWHEDDFADTAADIEVEIPNGGPLLNTYEVFLNSRGQAAGETADEFREAFEAVATAGSVNSRVVKHYGRVRVRDAGTKTRPLRFANEETALAAIAKTSMYTDLMQPAEGLLEDVMEADVISEATDLLVQQNWLVIRELPGREGQFFIGAALLDAADTDMTHLHFAQIYDAVTNRLRTYGQNYYGKPLITNSVTGLITSDDARKFDNAFESAVAQLIDGSVFLNFTVDSSQSYRDGAATVLRLRYRLRVAGSIGKVELIGTLSIGL